jgi:P27 family predicted phage terminase small subunit
MGERGPVPKGYARRRNQRYSSGTSVMVERPPMPRTLPAEAKAEWHRVVPVLEDIGLVATIDRGVLIRYCQAWSDWIEFARLLEKSGKLIRGQKGNLVRNPVWMMKRDAEQTIADLARQLGLTPAARMRAGVRHERPPDPEEESRKVLAMEEYKRAFGGS